MSKSEFDARATFSFAADAHIDDYATLAEPFEKPKSALKKSVAEVSERQTVLYADDRHALLLVFQGMDCAGKDSTIKAVTTGINPQGIQVAGFKAPTYRELEHSYLWRYWKYLPERGHIGIFNRSHYEEVLVVRVHPKILGERNIPETDIDQAFWELRMHDIRELERHLDRSGIHVVKFFLNVSKEEQKRRLLRRIDRPDKHWKFNPSDLDERELWPEYRNAYQQALSGTHSAVAPWYVIPADSKPQMRAIVSHIVRDHLRELPIHLPVVSDEDREALQASRERLAPGVGPQ